MIVANLETYPPRRSALVDVAARIAPQVDQLNIVLNEYDAELPELKSFDNVVQILPAEDTKDVGKFYPDVSDAEFVALIDDDLVYPQDYIIRAIESLKALGPGRFCAGYHASMYQKPAKPTSLKTLVRWLRYGESRIAEYRKVFTFDKGQSEALIVDQVASGTAIMRGTDMPSYAFMAGSQKYVDVRLARWCFENAITPVVLPRSEGWFGRVEFEETIYRTFTKKNPPHVSKEIMSFAFKTKGRGSPIGARYEQ